MYIFLHILLNEEKKRAVQKAATRHGFCDTGNMIGLTLIQFAPYSA